VTTAEQEAKNVKAFESVVKVAALGGGPILPLGHWFTLAPIEPTGGHWYFSVECPVCRRMSPMFRDFSDGHLGRPFTNGGVVVVCYFCKADVRCVAEAIRPVEWALEPGQPVPKSEYANRVARKHVQDPEYRPLRGSLHHYTSVAALSSILKSKTFWATNIRYLEDASEGELGLARMRQVAEEARKRSKGIDADILEYLVQWLDSPKSESASVYVLSFSTDHNKLSQWKGFTTYGEGVCLSINSMQMVKRMQAQGWTFQNCRYSRVSQLTWADAILSRIRREIATNHSGNPQDKKKEFDIVLRRCLPDLLQVAATIKHDAFVDESEVRFISPLIDIDDSRIRYRMRAGKATRIPYVEFRFADAAESVLIDEVMVGPGPEQHLVQASIVASLKEAGVNPLSRVSLSDIPYRVFP
jgi:hypothetical protein